MSTDERIATPNMKTVYTIVCFASSFRLDGSRGGEESPNITHAVLDRSVRTLCGRAKWATQEDVVSVDGPEDLNDFRQLDCLVCAARLVRLVTRGSEPPRLRGPEPSHVIL